MFAQSLKRPRDEDMEFLGANESKRLCPPWLSVPESRPDSAADNDQSLRFQAPTLTPIDSSDDEGNFEKQGALGLSAGRPGKPKLHLGANVNTAEHLRPVLASGDNLSPWLSGSQLGSVQPSPIPHQLVNQSLTINGVPTTTPTHGYFPAEASPIAPSTQQDLHMTVDTTGNSVTLPPAIRLPSPVSDDGDAVMATLENTGDADADAEMGDYLPPNFTQTASPAPSVDFSGVYQQAPPVMADNHHTSACTAAPRRRSPLVMGYRADCNKCQCKVPGHYSHIRRG
ncbi:uncharacterized protein N7496_011149 [Penicillium cataractarum]|uniref:Uncharacterized protein n=1 Tax=Penicillium cataractarum TaxID=2100454 RepID=A0A9W9UXS3_9EURO|nr:uncharacterized protein N7496_011149 [Penicillium cataractarum]KAJ5358736.1 hypothetical protein N7496_011149 [Penicillium cataractarum]